MPLFRNSSLPFSFREEIGRLIVRFFLGMPLFVIDCGGRNLNQWFWDGPPSPVEKGHAPIGFHALAACSGGAFLRDMDELPKAPQTVLLLLRPQSLNKIYKLFKKLRAGRHRVIVSLKDLDTMQISETLQDVDTWRLFSKIVSHADAYLAPTYESIDLFVAAGAKRGSVIFTPYPLEYPEWNFSQFLANRSGVIVGTHEFNIASRQHLQALTSLARSGIPATVVNTGGRKGESLISSISGNFRIIEGPLPYVKYLRLLANHRVVFQLDAGRDAGRVAGNALLCRMPCVGGNGLVDRLVFPKITNGNHSYIESIKVLNELLTNDTFWTQTVEEAERIGLEKLAFAPIAAQIAKMIA